MTTKTTKTILFAAAFAIFATSMLMIVPTTLQVQAAQADTLSVTEQNAISTSIKSYEIMNLKPSDSLSKIDRQNFSFDFKGKSYDLMLFEDPLLNNAVTDDNTENAKAFVGYVKDDPKSKASIIISDNEVAGTIRTAEKTIQIEPLSFYGENFSGDRQIAYDLSDLEFEFSFDESDAVKPNSEANEITKTTAEFASFMPTASADPGHQIDTIIDTDDEYFLVNINNCATRLLTVVGGVNTIYTSTDATINLVQYNCDESYLDATSISDYLDDLRLHWDGETDSRDAVLGFIGDDPLFGTLGSAYTDTVTDNNWAYGVAQLTDDSWTGYDASTLEQNIVVSHEMGHIMSCGHDNTQVGGKYTIMAGGVAIDDSTFDDIFRQTCIDDINDSADANL